MDVSIVGRGEQMKSRFLRAPERRGDAIIIEAPTLAGSPVAVRARELVDVVVVAEGERYGFRVPVLKRTRARLGGNVEVFALAIAAPAAITQLQRRRYFRVRIPALEPIMVGCVTKAPGSAKKPGGQEEYIRFETRALDISAGGMCLKVPKKHPHCAKPGVRLVLEFRLPATRKIKLLCETRYSREMPGSPDWATGVEFLGAEKTLGGRRAVANIARYVTRRQREELKKKSGLE
jgi:c-di-GMP-binding flagellar brake protein YcgR